MKRVAVGLEGDGPPDPHNRNGEGGRGCKSITGTEMPKNMWFYILLIADCWLHDASC